MANICARVLSGCITKENTPVLTVGSIGKDPSSWPAIAECSALLGGTSLRNLRKY